MRTKLLPALLFAAIPLAFLAGIAIYQLGEAVPAARHAREDRAQSFERLQALRALEEAVLDAESAQRGYLITGDEAYLQPYLRAKEELPQLMAKLHQALQDNHAQQERLLPLQADLTTKMNELATTVAAYKAQGFEAARAIVETHLGRNSMRAVHSDIAAIADAEKVRLGTKAVAIERAEQRVTLTFVAGGLVSCFALIAGAGLLASAYGRARRSEAALQATLDSVREGVATFDDADRLQAWNMPFAKILGLLPATLKRGELVPAANSPDAAEVASRIAALDLTVRKTQRPALISHTAASGKTFEIFHNHVGHAHVTTVLDVTEQRKADRLHAAGAEAGIAWADDRRSGARLQ